MTLRDEADQIIQQSIQAVLPDEAGHPVLDENSFSATQAALNLVERATAEDEVIFLLSGGGSALFEKPLVSGEKEE